MRRLVFNIMSCDIIAVFVYRDLDSSTKEKPDITKLRMSIRDVTHKMDLAYGMLGSLFRSGSRQTFFSSQVNNTIYFNNLILNDVRLKRKDNAYFTFV
jgi:5'-nucleotidase